ASQAAAGLNFLFGWAEGDTTEVLLVIGITAIALVSVLAGLEAGVQRLSQVNMSLAALLMLFVIIVGPTMAILTGFVDNLYNYVVNLPALSNPVGREDLNYSQGWTSFYWAWWIAWSPFVGMFIARVSRGRTVREFLISVLLIPSLACIFWMTVFGTAAIEQFIGGAEKIASEDLPLQLFVMLEGLPWTGITSFVGIILVMVFFITSSDSGSLVIDTISAGGKVEAPVPQRIFWCTFEGLVAIALILGGGLVALQAMAVSAGLPFTLVLLAACVAVVQGLRSEPRVGKTTK
ncbi:MAG: BCCT family transporter, partial [Pseudomonadota bacterium]